MIETETRTERSSAVPRGKVFREESAGFIVFRTENGIRKYLLLHKPASSIYKESWAFPKGLVEKDEGEKEAAIRETKEEAGISEIKVIDGFKETIKFFYKKEGKLISKIITWFLGETTQTDAKVSFEHKEAKWFGYEDAMKILTFKTDKEVLEKAEKYLKNSMLNYFS